MAAEPDCELVAVVSRDRAKAEDISARLGARHAYTDYEDMLDNPEVDVVYIATPNSLHASQVVAAARAGKHVFCEKPLAIDPADAEQAVRACAEAGARLGINFHNRYVPWVQDVSRMVADGAVGRVKIVEVDVGSGPREYENWRADPVMAGLGSVHNVGVHALDFLRVILHAEPTEVVAMFDNALETGSVEMLAMILLRFDNGTLVYVDCNESLESPTNSINIHGERGRITGTGFTRSRVSGDLTVIVEGEENTTHYPAVEAHRRCLAAFTMAVLEDRDPVPSGHDGLRSAQLCAAIVRSIEERRVVSVDDDVG